MLNALDCFLRCCYCLAVEHQGNSDSVGDVCVGSLEYKPLLLFLLLTRRPVVTSY